MPSFPSRIPSEKGRLRGWSVPLIKPRSRERRHSFRGLKWAFVAAIAFLTVLSVYRSYQYKIISDHANTHKLVCDGQRPCFWVPR